MKRIFLLLLIFFLVSSVLESQILKDKKQKPVPSDTVRTRKQNMKKMQMKKEITKTPEVYKPDSVNRELHTPLLRLKDSTSKIN
jgi:hypothetical protein